MDVALLLSMLLFAGLSHQSDMSRYCEDLVRVTNLCTEPYVFMLCSSTCLKDTDAQRRCGLSTGHLSYASNDATKTYDASREVVADVRDEQVIENAINKQNVRHQETKDGLSNVRVIIGDNEKRSTNNGFVKRKRRMVGGAKATTGSFPWHVDLLFGKRQVCAGAVIAPDWIVAAAHCFDGRDNVNDWQVVASANVDAIHGVNNAQIRFVDNIIIHYKNFKYWKHGLTDVPDDYDVALIKLRTRLQYKNHLGLDIVGPVCLAGLAEPKTGTSCEIPGWNIATVPREMHVATVNLIGRDVCNRPISYGGKIHERAICGNSQACQFESGATLVCKYRERYYLQGLSMWSQKCPPVNPKKFGVYANIPIMKGWIIQTILGSQ